MKGDQKIPQEARAKRLSSFREDLYVDRWGNQASNSVSGPKTIFCRLGLHHCGRWDYTAVNECGQLRKCVACGKMQRRIKHVYPKLWDLSTESRKCTRCGAVQTLATTRGILCGELRALGVSATLAPRGRPEENSGPHSKGLIDISQSPIRWVNVREWDNEGPVYATEYGIPCQGYLPNLTIRSIRVKKIPMFGRVIAVRWKGIDKGAGVLERLNSDSEINDAIRLGGLEVALCTFPRCSCWVIPRSTNRAPSPAEWDCYQKIARLIVDQR